MAKARKKCFHYHAKGHWRRNYPKYRESLKIKKCNKPFKSMLVIESNFTISSTFSWILDFGASAHICTSMQGLIESRRLKEGDMILQVGNRAKITIEAVGTYPLQLLSGVRLDLNDCYYVPLASQNLIFMFVLA